MTLVDFPGYGHAVTSESIKSTWKIMIRDYVCNRIILTR
jgi:GTP-binding protein EngB required for normal cell division